MIVPLLVLQFQTTPPPAPAPLDVAGRGDRPVHVWLSSGSPLARGSAVRVYVQVASDGNLVVLQRRTDGRIGVLFPASPTGAPFVRAGTYEIHGPRDGAALVVAEPDGEGMILAALTTDPLQVDEFARQADWNSDALIPSWSGADAEGALSDIVQRMLGDGTSNYDLVTYTVASRAGPSRAVAPPRGSRVGAGLPSPRRSRPLARECRHRAATGGTRGCPRRRRVRTCAAAA